jgi:hypothetical protein
MKWKRYRRKWSWLVLRYHSVIYVEGLTITTSQRTQCPGQNKIPDSSQKNYRLIRISMLVVVEIVIRKCYCVRL